MFVINADNNSWVNAAWYPTMNWYLNTPLDWQYYTMFPSVWNWYQWWSAVKIYACNHSWNNNNTNPTISNRSSWNWNLSNACSFYEEYKANDIDQEIIYPFHYTWLCEFYWSSWYWYKFTSCLYYCYTQAVKVSSNTCPVNTIYNYNASTCLNNLMFYRFIAQKEFSWWEIVWKNIRWYLRACINNYFTTCCYTATNCCWKTINTCPLNLIVNIWLIHKDWTKDCMINCRMPFPYWCIVNASSWWTFCYLDNICPSATTYRSGCRVIDILPWNINTDWLEAEEWDRIFIEYCTEWCIKPQMIYTNCSIYSSPTLSNYWFQIFSMNNHLKNCNCYSWYPLYDYAYCYDQRYPWISFSID